MNKLEFKLRLPADGTLILSSVGPPSSGLGDAFFRDPQGRHEGRRLLAIRSMTRTVDPIFLKNSVVNVEDWQNGQGWMSNGLSFRRIGSSVTFLPMSTLRQIIRLPMYCKSLGSRNLFRRI